MSRRPWVCVSSQTVSPLTRHASWYTSWPIQPVYHRSGTLTLVLYLFPVALVSRSLLPLFLLSYFLWDFVSSLYFYELSFSLLCSSFSCSTHTLILPLFLNFFHSFFSTIPFPHFVLATHIQILRFTFHLSLALYLWDLLFSPYWSVTAWSLCWPTKMSALIATLQDTIWRRYHSLYGWTLSVLTAVITPAKSRICFLSFETTFHSQ